MATPRRRVWGLSARGEMAGDAVLAGSEELLYELALPIRLRRPAY